jgi:outer membrane protein assembly factor BamA
LLKEILNYRIILALYCAVHFAAAKAAESNIIDADEVLSPAVIDVEGTASKSTSNSRYKADFVAVPFIFSSESLSATIGAAGVLKHAGQAQASLFGIGLYSKNDSWLTYLGINNYQLPKLDQWLFSGEYYRANYKQGVYFVPSAAEGSPGVNSKAGVPTDKVVTVGDETYAKLHIKYVLPWGRGSQGAARRLIPARKSIGWDPRESGVSSITLTPFIQTRKLVGFDELPTKAQGLKLKLDWDNRDNGKNSHSGGRTSLTFSRDFGASGSGENANDGRESWTTWEFEQSGFFSLGGNTWFDEQTLALKLYVADTPTWNNGDNVSGDYLRPPSFSGISLGGFDSLRGYSSNQFVGRSAVLYSAEYRMQPKWQPLQTLPVFNLYNIPWWQWVMFAQAGQVSDEFSASELHQDMKWTVGAGVRFEVESVVVRTEFAYSGDERQFWVMVNQPF